MKKYFLFIIPVLLFNSCGPTASFDKDGGMRIVLQVDGTGISKEELLERQKRSLDVLRPRIDNFGLYTPNLMMDAKPGQIILEFAGKCDMKRLRNLLQASASLAFYETFDNKDLYALLSALDESLGKQNMEKGDTVIENIPSKTGSSLDDQLNEQKKLTMSQDKMEKLHPLFFLLHPAINDYNGQLTLQDGPMVGTCLDKDTAKVNAYIHSDDGKRFLVSKVKLLWSFKPDERTGMYNLVAIKTKPNGDAALSGSIIQDARKVMDNNMGSPQISVTMNEGAAIVWKHLTRDNIGNSIAIVIDDQVYSYPTVQGEIGGGQSSITGNFTMQEADDFVNVLKAGSLPYRLRIVSEEVILPGK